MKFTIKDALQLDSLKNAEVVAGHKGLENKILFINVMEVPDIADWIADYEMILTTAYPYRYNDEGLEHLVEELKKKKLSAFAIKPDRFITNIPQRVINIGNAFDIPIIKLASDARFDLIINEIMREVVNKDYRIIKKSEEIHKKFTQIILKGGRLTEIANILAEITNHSVLIEDKDHNEIVRNSDFIEAKEAENHEEKRSIYIYERASAYIKIISAGEKITDEDIMALERARDAAAIVLLKKSAEEEIERQYKNEFLDSVIKGKYKDRESLIERGKFFNVHFTDAYLLFLLDIDSLDVVFSKELEKKEIKAHNILKDIFNVVFQSFFSKSEKSIIWSMNRKIFVLYPVQEEMAQRPKRVQSIAQEMAKEIKSRVDEHIKEFSISIGVGRFYPDILDLNKSYKEAKEALRIGKLVWGDNQIYHYEDIQTYNMLIKSGSYKELSQYVKQKLGKLISYDEENNTDFLNTLENILKNDGNLKVTAKEMYLHPKTVSYRRDRIEKILEISLENVEEKFSLQMALKIKQLLYL